MWNWAEFLTSKAYIVIKLFGMRFLRGFWAFYQKLIIPSLVLSAVLSALALPCADFYKGTGFSYIFLAPAFHYFTYDLKNPNEYYFYYNLGLSKVALRVSTLVFSLIIGLLIFFI